MIKEYTSRFPNPKTHVAMQGNLLSTPPWIINREKTLTNEEVENLEDLNDYDTCLIGLGFHHFENYTSALSKLTTHLKIGGTIGIIDLFPDIDVRLLPP